MAFNLSTGQWNALTSFNNWINNNVGTSNNGAGPAGIPNWSYSWMQQQEDKPYPLVQTVEFMAPDGGQYFDDGILDVGTYPVSTPATNGSLSRVGIKITIQDDQGINAGAVQNIRVIRDNIMHALRNAGVSDDSTGSTPIPCIEIYDHSAGGSPPDTGITLRPLLEDGGTIERYIAPDESAPNLHTLEILCRFDWFELN